MLILLCSTPKILIANSIGYLENANTAKQKLHLSYVLQPVDNSLDCIQGNWYDSDGNLVLTISNGQINGCKVIAFLRCGDAEGYRIQEKNGYRDIGLVFDHENYKKFIYYDESIVLRPTKDPLYYESINQMYLGMSKKYLNSLFGPPDKIDAQGPVFPYEKWIYTDSFTVSFSGDMATQIAIYNRIPFKFDKCGLRCNSSINEFSKFYNKIGSFIEITDGEYIYFDSKSIILSVTKWL